MNHMPSKVALLMLCYLAGILFFSCDNDKLPEPTAPLCDTSATYDNQIKAIIDSGCSIVDCHDGGGGAPGDFTTYSSLEFYLTSDQIFDRVYTIMDMPLAPGELTAEEFTALRCWLEDGFPEN
ncbi:MAG: hypothetical protein AAFP19_05245 [Bacteroidota bacterium]